MKSVIGVSALRITSFLGTSQESWIAGRPFPPPRASAGRQGPVPVQRPAPPIRFTMSESPPNYTRHSLTRRSPVASPISARLSGHRIQEILQSILYSDE